MRRGDVVVSVLDGRVGKISERWGASTNPHYQEFLVHYPDHSHKIVRLRHLRFAMAGERRQFIAQTPS